jgi:hypothetical protein
MINEYDESVDHWLIEDVTDFPVIINIDELDVLHHY